LEKILKVKDIKWWEPWVLLISYFGLLIFCTILRIPLERTYPELSATFYSDLVALISLLIPLIYCLWKYGIFPINELIPGRQDFVVLVVAFLVEILFFGLTVGRTGFQMDEELKALQGFQYWAIVLKFTVFGPLIEELFLRRFLWELFEFLYSPVKAFFILVFIGIALHMHSGISWFDILWHIFAASLFTLTYIKSRRVVVPFIVHSFHNTLIHLLSH